jgi:hypothetical protein
VIVLLLFAKVLGFWAMTGGAVVALTTHAMCRPGPNY